MGCRSRTNSSISKALTSCIVAGHRPESFQYKTALLLETPQKMLAKKKIPSMIIEIGPIGQPVGSDSMLDRTASLTERPNQLGISCVVV
jgi:hypothetical protein